MSRRSNVLASRKSMVALQVAVTLTILLAPARKAWAQATWTITVGIKNQAITYHYQINDKKKCKYAPPPDQPGGPMNESVLHACPKDTVIWQYDSNPDYPITIIFNEKSHKNAPLASGVWALQGTASQRAQGQLTASPDAMPYDSYKYSIAVFDPNGNLVLTDDPEIKLGGGTFLPFRKLVNNLQKDCKCTTPECQRLWKQLINDLKADGLIQ